MRDLQIAAHNSWVVSLDNLSFIPLWLSDCLCRLSTGGGFSSREVYTDAEETVLDAKRPIIINGLVALTLCDSPAHPRNIRSAATNENEYARNRTLPELRQNKASYGSQAPLPARAALDSPGRILLERRLSLRWLASRRRPEQGDPRVDTRKTILRVCSVVCDRRRSSISPFH